MIQATPLHGWLEDKAYAALKPAATKVLNEWIAQNAARLVDQATDRMTARAISRFHEELPALTANVVGEFRQEIPGLVDSALAVARERVRLSPAARMALFLAASGIAAGAVFSFLAWKRL